MLRFMIAVGTVIAMLSVSGCGQWRGSNDVSTDVGADAMGSGPGMVTGKRGGGVIYQK